MFFGRVSHSHNRELLSFWYFGGY